MRIKVQAVASWKRKDALYEAFILKATLTAEWTTEKEFDRSNQWQ